MNDLGFKLFLVGVAIFMWALFSLMASDTKAEQGNCHKTYPIDYVLYTNLFCEVK